MEVNVMQSYSNDINYALWTVCNFHVKAEYSQRTLTSTSASDLYEPISYEKYQNTEYNSVDRADCVKGLDSEDTYVDMTGMTNDFSRNE